jgi:hypothetical protein
VCLLKDEVLNFHEKLVSEACDKFKVRRQKLAAHFTLKAPFETEDIKEVYNVTENFCREASPSEILIDGYGSFRKSTVFMKIKPSQKAIETNNQYMNELRKIRGLEWKSNERQEKVFHSTIVTKLFEDKFTDIWQYVNHYPCSYKSSFNNISVLIWRDNKWEVFKEFQISEN